MSYKSSLKSAFFHEDKLFPLYNKYLSCSNENSFTQLISSTSVMESESNRTDQDLFDKTAKKMHKSENYKADEKSCSEIEV